MSRYRPHMSLRHIALALAMILVGREHAFAQLPPTGSHYAGRASDTGHSAISNTGGYATSIPLDMPASRGGTAIPVDITYGGRGVGAAGLGWDVPVSYIRRDASFARRRPAHLPGATIQARETLLVSFGGRTVQMVPSDQSGTVWLARQDAPDLELRAEAGNTWRLLDREGRQLVFTSVLPNLWLLSSITTATRVDRIELEYDVLPYNFAGGSGTTIDLAVVRYNTHPTIANCSKNEIRLEYSDLVTDPLALTLIDGNAIVRARTLVEIQVRARENCGSSFVTLRRYQLEYGADADTQLPRLTTVTLRGRDGTPEASTSLPVATYGYGAATSSQILHYQRGTDVAVPSDLTGTPPIARTFHDANASSPGGGETYVNWQNLLDVTGDGRPDLVYQKNGQLWLATNRPAGGSATTLTSSASVQLSDTVYGGRPLASNASESIRYDYSLQNQDQVWRQVIDTNGDGRLDIIDASEEPGFWVVYLNKPGNPVTWVKRRFAVSSLRTTLVNLGHEIEGDYVPLARRTTGFNLRTFRCFEWNYSTHVYEEFTQGCSGPAQEKAGNEQTFTEWEVRDVNGDGYPDVLFNSSPVRNVAWSPPEIFVDPIYSTVGTDVLMPTAGENNAIRAVLDVTGVRFDDGTNPFSAWTTMASNIPCGIALWVDDECPSCGTEGDAVPDQQYRICGIDDVNGDGVADRIEYKVAHLGTGDSFESSNITIQLPDVARQLNTHETTCTGNPNTLYEPAQLSTLRDLTGDGIPDFIRKSSAGGWKISIGTGTAFRTEIPIDVPDPRGFSIAMTSENCGGEFGNTMGGVYDIDGDGTPEVVYVVQTHLEVFHLAGESAGNPQAGRLSSIDNGYGAVTAIRYRSAKEDGSRAHQVPFPEIVVTSVETTGNNGLGGTLSAIRYAYGDAALFFDPALDSFTMRAYGRAVTVYGTGPEAGQAAFAVVRETNSLPAFNPTMDDAARFARYQNVGRVRQTHVLGHDVESDPWTLLATFDPIIDSRRMAGQTDTWSNKYVPLQQCFVSGVDTMDIMDPYDGSWSIAQNFGHAPCGDRGFSFTQSSESWLGTQPPGSSASNVQTRVELLTLDDFGNVLSAKNENDLFRGDDDLCFYMTYATPAPTNRVLSALTTRRVTKCPEDGPTLSFDSYEYDGLPLYSVALGRVTAHSFERHATDNGALLGAGPIREFEADHDAVGNVNYLVSAREDGAVRSLALEFDEFALAPLSSTLDASALPPLETHTDRDPVTLDATAVHDANGTSRGAVVDGFGRVIQSTVQAPTALGVVSTIRYDGFSGTSPLVRSIRTKTFRNPVAPPVVDTSPGQEAIAHLDELGRTHRVEQLLGSDYGNETLIAVHRLFDGLGRVSFEADPHPASQSSATAYGTTTHFATDGTVTCSIRGHGPQLFNSVSDMATERFPTCFSRTFANNALTTSVSKPDALLAGLSQVGVTYRESKSAIGWVLSRETVQNGTRLELAQFSHDALGQLTTLTRWNNPVTPSTPVQSSFRLDSRGQTLELQEPETATRFFSYSNWGELLAVDWTDDTFVPSQALRIDRSYDALGRISHSVESRDAIENPSTVYAWDYDTPVLENATYTLGRLAQTTSPIGSMQLSYDIFGRVATRSFSDPANEKYVEKYEQDFDGSLTRLQLELSDTGYVPEKYDYTYDSALRLKTVVYKAQTNIPLYTASTVDAWGRLRAATFGENTVFSADYAETGRRLAIEHEVTVPGGDFRRINGFSYDPVGRELGRHESIGWINSNITNAYDSLGRLTESEKTSNDQASQYDTGFTYSALGNVLILSDFLSGNQVRNFYSSIDRDRLCRIRYTPPYTGTTCTVKHDGSGNLVRNLTNDGAIRLLAYYPSGAVESIEQNSTTARFYYDGSGEISQLDVEGPFASDPRRDRRYGLVERRDIGYPAQSIIVRNIPGVGGIVASRRGVNGPWIFPFGEARGTRTSTDGSSVVHDVTYSPFGIPSSTGAQPGSPEYTQYQWNSGDALADFGIVQVGARLYDPVIGRFLSRDPLVLTGSATSMNPYAFALNDPINFTDPTGMCTESPDGTGCTNSWISLHLRSSGDSLGFGDIAKFLVYDINPLVPAPLVELFRSGPTSAVSVAGHRLAIAAPFASPTALGIGTGALLEGMATYNETDSFEAALAASTWSVVGAGLSTIVGTVSSRVAQLATGGGGGGAGGGTGGGAGGGGAGPQRLFRIITEREPIDNLLSNAAKGLKPRGPEVSDPTIHKGLSMFDTLAEAATRVPVLERAGKTVIGIGEFAPGPGVTITKTLGPGHYTVTGSAVDLLPSWIRTWVQW